MPWFYQVVVLDSSMADFLQSSFWFIMLIFSFTYTYVFVCSHTDSIVGDVQGICGKNLCECLIKLDLCSLCFGMYSM